MISVPPGTEMFQFPGLAPFRVTGLASGRVSPFGHPGITAHVQLPQAYRSLSRPSSPLDAKASTVCLIAFDLVLYLELRCDSFPGRDHEGHVRTSFHLRLSKSSEGWEREPAKCGRHQMPIAHPPKRAPTRQSRKEVIQPQVPLRLPCYDFAPVTELTFGGCLLAVSPPTSGPPSFHGVTGGVYKARERIHRGVADPRLLAIPTSWSRVADSNPN